jgi:TPR repeat protein
VKVSSAQRSKAARLCQHAQKESGKGNGFKAFRLFLQAAKLGDEEAQVAVGYGYAYGWITEANEDEALRWWKRAYKQGSWDAAFNLGMYFRDGKRWDKALKWFERAVKAGDEDGLIEIAKIHLRYGGDRAAGMRYLELAIGAKDRLTEQARLETERVVKEQEAKTPGELLYLQICLLDDQRRYKEALPLLIQGAEAGDSSCQLQLGNYLSDGRKGVPVDRARGIHWYEQAFEQDSTSGAANLALTYWKKGDVDEAYRWYKLAAAAGDNGSHLSLAKIWLYEREDTQRAIEHLRAVFAGSLGDSSEADRDEASVVRHKWNQVYVEAHLMMRRPRHAYCSAHCDRRNYTQRA